MQISALAESLQDSFTQMRLNAVCDDDVVGWIASHPECIPNVPDILKPYLQVRQITEKSHLGYRTDVAGIKRLVAVDFKAILPATAIEAQDTNVLSSLLGRAVSASNYNDRPLRYDGYITLELIPQEWSYVWAEAVHSALNSSSQVFKEFVQADWQRIVPNMAWTSLVDMHGAGLIPENTEELRVWLATLPKQTTIENTLPSELTV